MSQQEIAAVDDLKKWSTAEYKEYLKNIKELELSCYEQERLIHYLQRNSLQLRRSLHQLEQANKKTSGSKSVDARHRTVRRVLAAACYGAVGAAVGCVFGLLMKDSLGGALRGAIECTIVGLFFGLWAWLLVHLKKRIQSHRKEYNHTNYAGYASHGNYVGYGSYVNLETEPEKIAAQMVQLKSQFQNETTILKGAESMLSETKTVLEKYYDTGVLYPKYHGLVPVSMLSEYLELGRCLTLTGPDGAYNLYETELRENRIVEKLSEVLSKLESSDSQRMLTMELKQSNDRIDALRRALNHAEQYTLLLDYYKQLTTVNAAHFDWLKQLENE